MHMTASLAQRPVAIALLDGNTTVSVPKGFVLSAGADVFGYAATFNLSADSALGGGAARPLIRIAGTFGAHSGTPFKLCISDSDCSAGPPFAGTISAARPPSTEAPEYVITFSAHTKFFGAPRFASATWTPTAKAFSFRVSVWGFAFDGTYTVTRARAAVNQSASFSVVASYGTLQAAVAARITAALQAAHDGASAALGSAQDAVSKAVADCAAASNASVALACTDCAGACYSAASAGCGACLHCGTAVQRRCQPQGACADVVAPACSSCAAACRASASDMCRGSCNATCGAIRDVAAALSAGGCSSLNTANAALKGVQDDLDSITAAISRLAAGPAGSFTLDSFSGAVAPWDGSVKVESYSLSGGFSGAGAYSVRGTQRAFSFAASKAAGVNFASADSFVLPLAKAAYYELVGRTSNDFSPFLLCAGEWAAAANGASWVW